MTVFPRWLLHSLLTLLLFGLWAAVPKAIGPSLSSPQQQALSTLGFLPIMLVLLRARKTWVSATRLRGVAFALLAGLFLALGNLAYYYALHQGGQAATLAPLGSLYPVVTLVLSVLILREKHSALQTLGILTALAAIAIFNAPDGPRGAAGWALLPLLPIAFWGVTGVFQKLATNHVSVAEATFFFLLASVPVAILLLFIPGPAPAEVPARDWALVMLLGGLLGLGNLTMIAAYAGGQASIVAPISGLYWVVTIPLGILLFDEKIASRQWLAIGLTLVATVALSYERQERKNPTCA